MKLDLLNKEISDIYVRENFVRVKRELEAQQILGGYFSFFEVEVTSLGTKVPIKHNLSFIPRDIIILSLEGDHNLYFNYEDFDAENIYVTTKSPCRVRFLAGSYKGRAYGGSKKDFTFVAPSSSDAPIWYNGAGNPTVGLGSEGDFYLNTTTGEVFLKTGTYTWTSEGYLNSIPPSLGSQITEVIPVATAANIWTSVPLTQITNVADVQTYDATLTKIEIEWRIVGGGSQVEIRSKKVNTYTVYVEGYIV